MLASLEAAGFRVEQDRPLILLQDSYNDGPTTERDPGRVVYELKRANPGSRLQAGEGIFTFDKINGIKQSLIFPPDVEIVGRGAAKTILRCPANFDDSGQDGPAFLPTKTLLMGLTLEATSPPDDGQQSAAIGYGPMPMSTPPDTTLVDVALKGLEFGVYCWGSIDGAKFTMIRGSITAAFAGMLAGRSNGPTSQYIDAYGVKIVLNGSLSPYIGKAREGVFGFPNRRGRIRSFNCSVTIMADPAPGDAAIGRAAAVCDSYDGGNADSLSEHYNLQSKVIATKVQPYDFDQRIAGSTMACYGRKQGSGSAGEWLVNGKVLGINA